MWTIARGRARAGGHRREPAGGAGLGGVGVEDVRPPVPDDPTQGEDRGGVGAERELSLQHGQPQHVDAELLGDVLHRLLASCQRARDDDDVVAAPRLLVRELEDVQCGTPDIQSRDHVDDRQAHVGCCRRTVAASAGATAAIPMVSQKMAASGTPPNSAAPASPPARAPTQAAGR